MGELIFKVSGIALIAAMAALLLKKWGADFALLVKLGAGIFLATLCMQSVTPIVAYLEEACNGTELARYLKVLLRVLCVAFLTHICASICRDCGEGTIACFAELGGKIEIVLLCLPLMEDIFDIAARLLEMG